MAVMTPSEAFVETLAAQGVTTVFGIVGSAYMDPLDLFEPAGIRFISVSHEQGAGHMADGFSRISNSHGVCIAQNGPGITNFVTSIAAAYWAHSPVVCITPEAGTSTMGLGGFQETEQLAFFEKITKYQAHVNRQDRIAELTSRAFDIAIAERGPTQVNIPRDFFYGEIDIDIDTPIRIEPSSGGAKSLNNAATLISEANFPVIIAGGGVTMAKGTDSVKSLAEFLSAPVVTSYLHNDAFPSKHALSCGPLGYQGSKAAMNIIEKADVILAIGTRLGPFGTLPQYGLEYWPENAKVIQIDRNQRAIGLVKPINIGICGDAQAATDHLLGSLKANKEPPICLKTRDQRINMINKEKSDWEKELNSISQGCENELTPRHALRELEKALPSNAIVSTDIGNICSVANSYLRFEKPGSFLAAMSFGNCGYAFPTAIGAKVAEPDRPVVAYVGDGAWGMSLQETLTCVRENLPVTAVVFNNGQWGAEKKNQIDYYNDRFVGTNLKNPSFAEIGRAMGANGIRVSNPDEIGDALISATSSNVTTILEIMVNEELGEPFRRDALQKPVRHLSKYQSYT
ncbi:MAG: sulfoacetaldehyde acetyltransferase [Rhodospirillaceae bacterium]|nr:sulfoacetaldehyde acetyltransferase [Rhodospirillaceae bacterium]